MPNALSAIEAAEQIRVGRLTSTDLVKACLKRIDETDGQIKAWTHLDTEYAIKQAEELDLIRQTGRPLGALHGVPIGLKDIIDTKKYPTEHGSPIHKGRRPDKNAHIVGRLLEAGAVILGKTVSTEFAFLNPAETRNPHNVKHSPGGSSSGSAAAVAAFHVPLAIGTQTNGSVIRPASFCGTYGFKPTQGVISRTGLLQTSKTLDQVGVFGRTLEDIAHLSDVIGDYDQVDVGSYARPRPQMLSGAKSEPPVEPSYVWFDLPFNDRLEEDAKQGFEALLESLGNSVERVSSPPSFPNLIEVQRIIHEYEIMLHLKEEIIHHWNKISAKLQLTIERARKISTSEYQDALSIREQACKFFDSFFKDYDAVITPSAAGEACLFDDGTGDPIFCTLWTLCGLPALNLPLLVGNNDLPVGVQLIGAQEEDDRLLRSAGSLVSKLKQDTI